jgi:MSHA pilin protein MshC
MKNQRGFTIVELVMTIVIMGILAAVVGPRFFDRQVFDERLFFEESVAAVRYAQKLALASGCKIEVSLGAGGYRLRRAADCSSGAYTAEVQGPDGQAPFANTQIPSGVQVAATNFPVVFDSLGRPTQEARASIGAFALRVHSSSGLVEVLP